MAQINCLCRDLIVTVEEFVLENTETILELLTN